MTLSAHKGSARLGAAPPSTTRCSARPLARLAKVSGSNAAGVTSSASTGTAHRNSVPQVQHAGDSDTGGTVSVQQQQQQQQQQQPSPEPLLDFSDLGRLHGLFGFSHTRAAADQDSPTWLLGKLEAFLQTLKSAEEAPVSALWTHLLPSQAAHLQDTVQYISNPGSGLHVEWLPRFGCALLPLAPLSDAVLQPDQVTLYLVAADGWRFQMHSSPAATQVGGVLLVAPEHRNSMHLKYLELALAGDEGAADLAPKLRSLLGGFSYWDILDESDEVLHHHRRQLVYAWGDSVSLPALEQRTQVVQGLLLGLSELVDAGNPVLNKRGLVLKSGGTADRKPGSFCGILLLPGEQLEESVDKILALLAKSMVDKPRLQDELGWLTNFPDKALLLQLLTDRTVDAHTIISSHPVLSLLPDDKRDQLLTARGLLACGLLVHGLQSRHRVKHGINRSPSAKKRLSVPYRAADLPSERSEFTRPEVALIYTHLAYFGDGLSLREFKEAVQTLLSRGPSEQAFHYNRWLQQGKASGSQAAGCTAAFDSVDKLDPGNSQLLGAMWAYFSHNMETVSYWLANCVLPLETKQYPSRLVATAWHLAQNPGGKTAGFSGTKDNHRLLPTQVVQVPLADAPQLQGTDGKMLDMLLNQATYCTLELGQASTPWEALLLQALERGVDAIIDCGALLAGVDLRLAAEFILARAPSGRYRGVTFFCRASGCWVILDAAASGRLSPKEASHLRESETLAVFDDARCRGADLKLRQGAVGLLTLAPEVPKDRLMQAAGRLRQLGEGQTLQVMGLPDVTSKILSAYASATAAGAGSQTKKRKTSQQAAAAEPDMAAVLTWVVCNTVAATLAGIGEAASQGMQFAATYGGPPEACVLAERLEVGQLYGSSRVVEDVPAMLAGVAAHYTAHASKHFADAIPAPAAPQLGHAAAVGLDTSGDSSCLSAAVSMAVDEQLQLSASPSSSMSLEAELGLQGSSALASSSSDVSMARTSSNGSSGAPLVGSDAVSGTAVADVVADIRCVQDHFSALGAGHAVVAGSGADEECERELEQEEEEEQEAEVQVPAATAAAETAWDYRSAFTASSPAQLQGCTVLKLSQVLQRVGSAGGVQEIGWCDRVCLSHNFLHSIAAGVSPGLSDYLRPVGALLLFPGRGELLLLSEREADALQSELWVRPPLRASSSPNLLLSLPYLRLRTSSSSQGGTATSAGSAGQPPLFLASQLSARGSSTRGKLPPAGVSGDALVSVCLFAGCVMYGSEMQRDLLHSLMRGRKEAAQELVVWRGKLHTLSRSDLDRACADDAFESR